MNHPSEWTKCFDENTGRYRYKHKGWGLIRDTVMAIGKAFKGTAKNVVKRAADKAAKTVAEKAGQKVGEIAVEKGSKQIQEYCQSVSQNHKRCRRMQKRNLKTFCKTKCRKNPLSPHLPP